MAWGDGKIVSFGWRWGAIPPGADAIIDVRERFPRNPWRLKKLRDLTGKDAPVIEDILEASYFSYAYEQLLADVSRLFEKDTDRTVLIGCTGGRHRSVYLADRLGRDLRIPVEHRDLNRHG